MPKGLYAHRAPVGGETVALERFSCAGGPSGWRYVGEVVGPNGRSVHGRIDLTVDSRWRQIRLEVRSAGVRLRGGVTGREVTWVRLPERGAPPTPLVDIWLAAAGTVGREESERAVGFAGRSPALTIATARLLDLPLLGRARVRLVALGEPTLGTQVVDEGWALVDVTDHDTDSGPLRVERYEVADVATTARRVVHLAGDVLLDAPGIELRDLDSPPNQPARRPGRPDD